MRAPVTGAVLCAIAAIALLVAGFTPWFSTGKEIDSRMAYERRRAEAAIATFDDIRDRDRDEPEDETDVRANFGLVTGEVCVDLECKAAKYTGAPGLSDDAFAWLGRGTLGAALASVVLLIAVALAARVQRRAVLRGWAATVAAVAAGLGAAFAAAWTLDTVVGYVSRGMGLTAAIAGAAFAGLGVGWPSARGNASAARRYSLAFAIAVLATLAWVTMIEHAWWRSGKALEALRVSPLGVQVCEGGDCKLATALGVTTPLRSLAALTSLASAVLLVPAFGAAGRIARGVRPGAWGWSAAIVAMSALVAGVATFFLYPSSDIMHVGWGLPLFVLATAGTFGVSVAGIVLIGDVGVEAPVVTHLSLHEPAFANAIAPGERPQLAALGAPSAPVARATEASNPVSKYAPKIPAATPIETATVVDPIAPAPSAAIPVPVRAQPTAPTAPVRKSSPMCPTCRVTTLWSSKRNAWWCSTCKQTL